MKGLDRPGWQWGLVSICVLLTAFLVAAAVSVRRAASRIRDVQATGLNARLERDKLEAQLSRERAAREALSLELARERKSDSPQAPPVPTLTLEPSRTRRATPPEGTVAAPAPDQTVLLRLMLPQQSVKANAVYNVSVRDWSNGQIRWTRDGLSAVSVDGGVAVACHVTGDMLLPGSYELRLTDADRNSAARELATYEVTVGPAR